MGVGLYPRNSTQLIDYLKKNPVVKLVLPSGKENTLTFINANGLRLNFTDPDGHLVTFACSGVIAGVLEYNEDGFTRTIAGKTTAWYYYTGDKPWQNPKPEWKQKIEDWGGVFEGLKGFAD